MVSRARLDELPAQSTNDYRHDQTKRAASGFASQSLGIIFAPFNSRKFLSAGNPRVALGFS